MHDRCKPSGWVARAHRVVQRLSHTRARDVVGIAVPHTLQCTVLVLIGRCSADPDCTHHLPALCFEQHASLETHARRTD
jgi:hypothetical protein